ncbi:MAG TPA: hypothetical protein VIK93_05955, partial [Limnochordales bacterium]
MIHARPRPLATPEEAAPDSMLGQAGATRDRGLARLAAREARVRQGFRLVAPAQAASCSGGPTTR